MAKVRATPAEIKRAKERVAKAEAALKRAKSDASMKKARSELALAKHALSAKT